MQASATLSHDTRPLGTESQQRRALAVLVALVLGVHLWLLLSSGGDIWRLQPESQKLGPLQTRVLSSGVSQTTPTRPSTEKTRQVAPAKPKAPESTSTPSSAGISAVSSSVLPAPEESPVLPIWIFGITLSIGIVLLLPKSVLQILGCYQIGSWVGDFVIYQIKKRQ